MSPFLSAVLLLSPAGILLAPPQVSPVRSGPAMRVIDITARRFEFSPRRIELEKGDTVRLRLTSTDVVHGYFQRGLEIDELIEPGKVTELTLTPETTGTFTVICHHFCGARHAAMKMTIAVTE